MCTKWERCGHPEDLRRELHARGWCVLEYHRRVAYARRLIDVGAPAELHWTQRDRQGPNGVYGYKLALWLPRWLADLTDDGVGTRRMARVFQVPPTERRARVAALEAAYKVLEREAFVALFEGYEALGV